MNQYSQWIKHLNDPLVLIGFTTMLLFMLFKTILTILKKGVIKLYRKGVERTINKILLYGFILALIIIITGFGLSYIKVSQQKTDKISQTKTEQKDDKSRAISQQTQGDQSPAVIVEKSDSNVKIEYNNTGEKTKTEAGSAKSEECKTEKNTPETITPDQIKQHTEGNQSPAIISGGDVELNFENK